MENLEEEWSIIAGEESMAAFNWENWCLGDGRTSAQFNQSRKLVNNGLGIITEVVRINPEMEPEKFPNLLTIEISYPQIVDKREDDAE